MEQSMCPTERHQQPATDCGAKPLSPQSKAVHQAARLRPKGMDLNKGRKCLGAQPLWG